MAIMQKLALRATYDFLPVVSLREKPFAGAATGAFGQAFFCQRPSGDCCQ